MPPLATLQSPTARTHRNKLGPYEGIDTTLLFEELRREYVRIGRPLTVDFRKIVNWIKGGDQLTHQIHPYPAKLLPNIAHFFSRVSRHTKRRTILDPFCGSGTVALEGSLAGLTPFIADANPFALLLAKVKTTPYDTDELKYLLELVITRAKRLRTAPTVAIVNSKLWYSDNRKKSLEILLRTINETTSGEQRDFFLICFSVAARKFSYADPTISVPVRLKTKQHFTDSTNAIIQTKLQFIEQADTLEEFRRICAANLRRVDDANSVLKTRMAAVVVGHDARTLINRPGDEKGKLQKNSIALTVTSPPYGSAQKYVRATSLSLNWLGLASPEQLAELEGVSIGREHLPKMRTHTIEAELPKAYENLLKKIKNKNVSRSAITRRYLVDMKTALTEIAQLTCKGGHVVLVVGNNNVCGHTLRNDRFIEQTLTEQGLTLELGLFDKIKSRGLITKRNETASMITRETIMVFKK